MYQIIQELEKHKGRLVKETVLTREAKANNTQFFDGLRIALDNYTTFGVKKIPTHSGPDGQGLPWTAFLELTHLLSTRKLTGHEARDAIELALSISTQQEWNDWYRRILIKDLRCGVTESTINKVLEAVNAAGKVEIPLIPIFECMLAHDGAKHESKITGVKLLEPKWDGVRCLTIVNYESRSVVQYSCNGKILENFPHVTDELLAVIDDIGRSFVIDGEMVSRDFQTLMKQVHRKSDVSASDAKYAVFDILPLSEFRAGKSTMTQKVRSRFLKTLVPTVFNKCPSIQIGDQVEVDLDSFVGEMEFKAYNLKAIELGFEGIMIKDPTAVYECKRSVSWLKQKPYIEVSLTVTALEEGTGRNAGKLGALVCEGVDDGKNIVTNVGTGLSDLDREEIWASKDAVIGQVIEVRADAVTQNQDSEDEYSLRFPRFLRFRGFAAGEKI